MGALGLGANAPGLGANGARNPMANPRDPLGGADLGRMGAAPAGLRSDRHDPFMGDPGPRGGTPSPHSAALGPRRPGEPSFGAPPAPVFDPLSPRELGNPFADAAADPRPGLG